MSAAKQMITIVDYGVGNRGSIVNMLKRIGAPCRISGDPQEVSNAEALIVPGVGAFDAGMTNLNERGLTDAIRSAANERRAPILGICLGMQLLAEGSEEGVLPGLSLVRGKAQRFQQPGSGPQIKIPNMGWVDVEIARPSRLFDDGVQRFYFVHSYHVVCDDPQDVTAFGNHGGRYVAAFERDNVLGVQFHPEKSHRYGMQLLKNFAERVCVPA